MINFYFAISHKNGHKFILVRPSIIDFFSWARAELDGGLWILVVVCLLDFVGSYAGLVDYGIKVGCPLYSREFFNVMFL